MYQSYVEPGLEKGLNDASALLSNVSSPGVTDEQFAELGNEVRDKINYLGYLNMHIRNSRDAGEALRPEASVYVMGLVFRCIDFAERDYHVCDSLKKAQEIVGREQDYLTVESMDLTKIAHDSLACCIAEMNRLIYW